jgi:membrane protease YdiL (CAAX protease family)
MDQEPSSADYNTETPSWAERNGFTDWALALMWVFAAFFLFQLTAGVVFAALLAIKHSGQLDATIMMESMNQSLDLVFIGNSTGQILMLGLATWMFANLHIRGNNNEGKMRFMRLRVHPDTLTMSAITVVLILIVQPAIWFMSWLNALIPVPEVFEQMQASQMQLIEQFLKSDHLLLLTLFHIGVVPAVCEEILYRGYVMRAFERSWGIWPAIIVSGILFGMYHLQLTNLLPLATIGVLLAYITWISRSLYPAMLAHFVNNGSSVLVGTYYPDSAFAELTPESMPPLWAVALSLVASVYLIYLMYNLHKTNTLENDV